MNVFAHFGHDHTLEVTQTAAVQGSDSNLKLLIGIALLVIAACLVIYVLRANRSKKNS